MYLLFDRNTMHTEMQLHTTKNQALEHKKNRIAKIKHSHQNELIEIYKINIKDAELLSE